MSALIWHLPIIVGQFREQIPCEESWLGLESGYVALAAALCVLGETVENTHCSRFGAEQESLLDRELFDVRHCVLGG
jgi:hypothetical protein